MTTVSCSAASPGTTIPICIVESAKPPMSAAMTPVFTVSFSNRSRSSTGSASSSATPLPPRAVGGAPLPLSERGDAYLA